MLACERLRFIWLHMVHTIACVMLKQQFFEIETNTRVPTSTGKPGKSQKSSMHGKIMEFEKKN